MKVATIVGARPQFIKCAPLSRELRKHAREVLIHTGQHYDRGMSDVFFEQLDIAPPDYNLGVGSGPHGAQSGEMLRGIEVTLVDEQPDLVLVYGDTNSTLAGALAAAKLRIPVAHVEAGLRSFDRGMPEEINRVLTDHVSTYLFCPTTTAVRNLEREGLTAGVELVGDVMSDALRIYVTVAEQRSDVLEQLGLRARSYYLATVHRAENVDEPARLQRILRAFERLSTMLPVVWPVHPRTRKMYFASHGQACETSDVRLIEPLTYLDMLRLEKNAAVILTDSGGVQKEAFWLGVPCVTLREQTEWVETVQAGSNRLVGTDSSAIVTAAARHQEWFVPYSGDSHDDGLAARRIANVLIPGSA